MGIWGAGLFENDDAADLRSDYRAYLADAQSDAGATDAIARDYAASLDRPQDTTSFWLALASVQWRIGRLDPRVKAAALTIIDSGADLGQWEQSPQRRKRSTILTKLRGTLAAPMPAAKPLPKPLPLQLPGWNFSEVVGYRASNGRYVLLHVLGYRAWTTVWARAPVVTVLNWFAEQTPGEGDVGSLRYINHNGWIGGHHLLCLAMPAKKALRPEQFDRPGWTKPVTRDEAISAVYGLSGHEGGTLERTLAKVLWPYWEDPTRPIHVPKEFPPDMDHAEIRRTLDDLGRRLFGRVTAGITDDGRT
jgi:hypothetical protein